MQMILIELGGRRPAQGSYVDQRRRDLTVRPTKLQSGTAAEIDSLGAHISFCKKGIRHGRRQVISPVDEWQSHHLEVPVDDRQAFVKSRRPNSRRKQTSASRKDCVDCGNVMFPVTIPAMPLDILGW
jgi:hypothetical protein